MSQARLTYSRCVHTETTVPRLLHTHVCPSTHPCMSFELPCSYFSCPIFIGTHHGLGPTHTLERSPLHALRHYDAESRRASSAVCGAHVNPNPKSQSVLPSSTRINPTHRYTPKHGRGHASPPCGQKAPWDVRSTQTGLSSLAMSSPLVRVASTLVAITQNKTKQHSDRK